MRAAGAGCVLPWILLVAACGGEGDGISGSGGSCGGSCQAGGSAGASGVSGGAGMGGVAPEGCVDSTVSPAVLPDPSEWLPRPAPIRGGFARTSAGLHTAWVAYRYYPDKSVPKYLENTTPWLVVSTMNANTGVPIEHRTYGVFPEGILSTQGELSSFAAREDGKFAVGFGWLENGQWPQRALLGLVTDSSPPTSVVIPVDGDPSQIALQTFAAWDGDAFALHAYGSPPQFTLHVARVDAQGNVLLPLTQFGLTQNVATTVVGHKSSTSPASGRTYVFDADGSNVLSGHVQDGAPLPGTGPALGGKLIEGVGFPTTSTSMPAVSADADGAWVAWDQVNSTPTFRDLVIQRIDLDGDPIGAAIKAPIAPLDEPGRIWRLALVSRGVNAVWVAGASAKRIYGFSIEDGVMGPVSVIVDSASEFDIRGMSAFEYQGETWLGFDEQHVDASDPHDNVLRVLRIKPGCIYPQALGAKQ